MSGRKEKTSDPRARLVEAICSASSAANPCPDRTIGDRNTGFIDWYFILQLGETASVDSVRKQFRHLALQLHPDKNKHPKAETAFKLLREAYACLSDEAKRRTFDSRRRQYFCAPCSPGKNNSRLLRQAFRESTQKLREDLLAIGRFLRVYALAKSESPIFSPSTHPLGVPPDRKFTKKSIGESLVYDFPL